MLFFNKTNQTGRFFFLYYSQSKQGSYVLQFSNLSLKLRYNIIEHRLKKYVLIPNKITKNKSKNIKDHELIAADGINDPG